MDYFNNEEEVLGIGNLTIENRVDRITISGDVDLTLDKEGLLKARLLFAHLRGIMVVLEYKMNSEKALALAGSTELADDVVNNPFA